MPRQTLKSTTLLLGAAVTLAAFAQSDTRNQKSTDLRMLMSIQTHGSVKYLADGQGYPLYTLVASSSDSGTADPEHMKTLPCTADCRAVWPPVTVADADPDIETIGVVDASLIGTTRLENGAYQVTFNGYPLYYNQRDLEAPDGAGGALAGQAVEAFGGTWYILHADRGEVFSPYDFSYDH